MSRAGPLPSESPRAQGAVERHHPPRAAGLRVGEGLHVRVRRRRRAFVGRLERQPHDLGRGEIAREPRVPRVRVEPGPSGRAADRVDARLSVSAGACRARPLRRRRGRRTARGGRPSRRPRRACGSAGLRTPRAAPSTRWRSRRDRPVARSRPPSSGRRLPTPSRRRRARGFAPPPRGRRRPAAVPRPPAFPRPTEPRARRPGCPRAIRAPRARPSGGPRRLRAWSSPAAASRAPRPAARTAIASEPRCRRPRRSSSQPDDTPRPGLRLSPSSPGSSARRPSGGSTPPASPACRSRAGPAR